MHPGFLAMNTLVYYLSIPFIYLLAYLPFGLLYAVSDFFYFFIFHVFRYRRNVVYTNLQNSFPEKTEREIHLLAKKFYSYLCDLTLETFKTLTFSKEEAVKHCTFRNPELFDKLFAEKKSIILVLGHFGNWEWGGNSFSIQTKYRLYVIYKTMSNQHFDKFVYKMRTRFGTGLIEMKQTFKEMAANRNNITTTAFIADQTPSPENSYWTMFLNQETPVFLGAEKIASKLNYPVVFVSITRVKRGYYEANAEVLFSDPGSTAYGEISERFTRRLEEEIIKQPEIWLWSHRRWKYKKPVTQA